METIIVTTDFSETSVHAAEYAAFLSGPLGVRTLVLYHSYEAAPQVTDVPLPAPKETRLAHEGSLLALEILESQIESFSDKQVVIKLVANDLPLLSGVEQLLEQHQGALVVAGMTGKGSVGKFLVGSHTTVLAESCSAPILIVPEQVAFEPIRKAVFACDLERVDQTVPIDILDELVTKLGCSLLVLNLETNDSRIAGEVIPEQYKLHEKLDYLNPEYHYIGHKAVAAGIMEFVEAHQVDLVLAMPKSRNFFGRLFHRSITQNLAHHTRRPLLLLRSNTR